MDADRFDTLIRTLTVAGSRRRAVAAALSGVLVPLLIREETDAHDALLTCQKLRGKRKKKCLKNARKHMVTHFVPACTPQCGGKDCGPDGCGSSCGPCTGGTCSGGTCTCPFGTETCRSACVSPCTGSTVRDPATCRCCTIGFGECATGSDCCSGHCGVDDPSEPPFCFGRGSGAPCDIPEQCAFDICTDRVCRCPSGKTPCGNGGCTAGCATGRMLIPGTCHCCTIPGESCNGNPGGCCASGPGLPGCDANGKCLGRADGEDCTFDEQCATNTCNRFGTCGEGVIGG